MTAHNKITLESLNIYAESVNIKFLDPEYISNRHSHNWECGRCGSTVSQRLEKIKRSGGKLSCCSRVSETNVNKGIEVAEKHNLQFDVLSFKNTQIPSKWECPIHGVFEYALFNALHVETSPCFKCREIELAHKLEQELKNFYDLVPTIKLVDSEYKGRRVSHKWHCSIHDYTTTSNLNLLEKNKRMKCCRGESYRGPNHPFYNKDISEDQRVKNRNYHASEAWSKAVRTRDKWQCVICGHNSKCVAHHLNSYLAHPEQRYDVDNGVTLCRPHHIDFHSKYGNTKTTKEEFEEYLNSINRSLSVQ